MDLQTRYPHLLAEIVWPEIPMTVQFVPMAELPPVELIANVNLVPYTGEQWVIIQLNNGLWEIPGGTLESGEDYLTAIQRELREEVGATLASFSLLGAWRCRSQAEKPYRPHLPFPESYRVVGVGEIALVSKPENPPDGEEVVRVAQVTLEEALARFEAIDRLDLMELYTFAAASKKLV